MSFQLDADQTVTLSIHTGAWAQEVKWWFDGGSGDMMSGPPDPQPISLGGSRNGYSSFFGSIAAVSLHGRRVSSHEAKCLHEYGESKVALCNDYLAPNNWRVHWLLNNGTLHPNITLDGDTYLDGKFGAMMDGIGDSLTVVGDDLNYVEDGTFGISLWFTKHECVVPGRYEMLWRHEDAGWRTSSVHIYIGW